MVRFSSQTQKQVIFCTTVCTVCSHEFLLSMSHNDLSSQLQASVTYAGKVQEIGCDCHLTTDLQTITAAHGCFNLP